MHRRHFIQSLLLGSTALPFLTGFRLWPDEGFFNPCHPHSLPEHLQQHPLMRQAWEGIEPSLFRDWHVHITGVGDNNSGIWLNPNMRSMLHPVQRLQYLFYMNASCAEEKDNVDLRFVERLRQLTADFPNGASFNLLAFTHHHDDQGAVVLERSPFFTPNDYVAQLMQQNADRFHWTASIHPYHPDALKQLQHAAKLGVSAIKWLPAAMNINPASPRCDAFYQALIKHSIPLLCHTGDEHAVDAGELQKFGNPLLLRRALDQGVTVIMAHCASMGENADIDKGENGKSVANIDLFARLMAEPSYERNLFGEISAITQVNRDKEIVEKIVTNENWHKRLLYGSDYPLPGVMPVFSPQTMLDWGFLSEQQAEFISAVRQYNPLLFDFLLKRFLNVNGKSFAATVFANPFNAS